MSNNRRLVRYPASNETPDIYQEKSPYECVNTSDV